MKTVILTAAAALIASGALAGPAVVGGVTATAGARDVQGAASAITSPILWIVHAAPGQTAAPQTSTTVGSADEPSVSAPLATAGAAQDVATAVAVTPVALR
jgi:hypothetical protein